MRHLYNPEKKKSKKNITSLDIFVIRTIIVQK